MLAIFSASLERELAGVSPQVARAVLAESTKLAGIEPPAFATAGERAAVTRAVKVSFVRGFRFVAFASAALAVLSALCAFLLLPRQNRRISV
jgi:hypothetical protein